MSESGQDNFNNNSEGNRNSPEYFLRMMASVQGRIYAYILSRWPNKSDADDIMQETISILWKKFDTYEPGTEFQAWAFTVVKYVLAGFRRKHQSNPIQFSQEALAVLESDSSQYISNYNSQIDLLRECIRKLPSKELKIIKLKYEGGLSSQKIAISFGMSIRTFYRVISKIHNTLIRCMSLSMAGGKI